MIVLDAAAIPGFFSGARTRLRHLLGAYARRADAPRLIVLVARATALLDGVALPAGGPVTVEEVAPPGPPWERFGFALPRSHPLGRAARLWHSETIPPIGPKRTPALLTLHDLRWRRRRAESGADFLRWLPRHAYTRFWFPALARSLAGIVTVSRASADEFARRLRVPAARIHVIRNAVDPAALAPLPDAAARRALRQELGVDGAPFVVALGHLEPRKGLELVLDLLQQAPEGSPLARTKLVLIGGGGGQAELAARGAALGARLVFAGVRDDAAAAGLVADACALVFPSRIEGFGFPVYEALARGTPVVASELPCLAELAALAPRGLALRPRTLEAWSAALTPLCGASAANGAAPRAELPRTAPTWDDAAAELAALYTRLLAPR